MKVCNTNGLHPTVLEAGIESLWTPKLIPRLGYCNYGCVLCTRVCPSGAIKRLFLEEKHKIILGKARIDHNRGIPWVGYMPGSLNWRRRGRVSIVVYVNM